MMRIAAGTVLFGVLTFAGVANAGAVESSADQDFGLKRCDDTIDRLRAQLAHVTLLGNIFTLVGAGAAALCSAIAGSTSGKKAVVAGTIGVAGAIVAALPKTLPDRADIQRKISLADQHRVRGEKTVRQISYLAGDFTTECKQYAVARFTECTAEEPSSTVPDLPVEGRRQGSAVEGATQVVDEGPIQAPRLPNQRVDEIVAPRGRGSDDPKPPQTVFRE